MDKIKISIISDNIHGISGYANVMRNLLLKLGEMPKFKDKYEVTQLGLGKVSKKITDKLDWVKVYSPHKDPLKGIADYAGYINEVKPHIVITFNDPWLTLHPLITHENRTYKWIQYVAIDSYPIPEKMILGVPQPNVVQFINTKDILTSADMTIFFTEWAKNLAVSTFDLDPKKVDHIPHGIDIEKYKPPSHFDKLKYRKEIFGRKVRSDDYLIITVARNQPRKLYGHMFRVLSNFLATLPEKERKRIKIYWHADIVDKQGLNLLLLKTGLLKENLIFKHEIFSKTGPLVPDEIMVKIYKSADAHLLLTSREGFNIPALESMAINLPLILTKHPVHEELYGKYAFLIPPKEYVYAPYINVTGHIPDVNIATKILCQLYQDHKNGYKLYYGLIKNGHKLAKKFDWNKLAEKWLDILEKISYNINEFKPTIVEL